MPFETPQEAREFAFGYKNILFSQFYGFPNFEYTAINQLYGDASGVSYDIKKINIGFLDIETESENGWPDIDTASERINLITLGFRGKKYTFGLGAVIEDLGPGVKYKHCKTEEELLESFLSLWKIIDLDIVTGWNVDFFDITYIVNRTEKILGKGRSKELSPWGFVQESQVERFGKKRTRYNIKGIAILDYLDLYKKYTYKVQESYKLDYIAHVELGSSKIDYSDVGSMKDLYRQDFTRFVRYNIQDVDLIEELEKKKRFLELACTVAYATKVTFRDIFTTVKLWDVIIANYLYNERKQIVPFEVESGSREAFEGGFVKAPNAGKYDMVASFDLTSLYPSLIMTHNISPETILKDQHLDDLSIEDVVTNSDKMQKITQYLVDNDLSVCSNGSLYKRNISGFLPELMRIYFNRRKDAKKKMFTCIENLSAVKAEIQKRGIDNE